MLEFLSGFWDTVTMYWGDMRMLLLFAAAVCILIFWKKLGKYRVGLLALLAGLLILVFNPLSQYVWTNVMREHLYWRMFWILPAVPVMAFVMTGLVQSRKKWKNALIGACVIAAIAVCGQSAYRGANFQKADNRFKLPQEAVMVADYMLTRDGETKALVADELYCYIRQYTSKVSLLYGRDIIGYTAPVKKGFTKIHAAMNAEHPDVEYLIKKARKYGCQYIVWNSAKELDGEPEDYGFFCEAEIGRFKVYRDGNGSEG
ncbi:MAG: hypothetical protein Q4F41_02540 [Eubacteriales bacterium]|nr:hypothetical protein [Eubacteriales bacterium]